MKEFVEGVQREEERRLKEEEEGKRKDIGSRKIQVKGGVGGGFVLNRTGFKEMH